MGIAQRSGMSTTLQTRGQIVAALPAHLREPAEALFRSNALRPSGTSTAGEALYSPTLVRTAADTEAAESRAAREGRHRVAAQIPGRTRSASDQIGGGIQFSE